MYNADWIMTKGRAMGKQMDLAGQRFGKWTVLEKAVSPPGKEHQSFWLCQCECGAESVRRGAQLRYAEKRGVVQSCQRCGAIAGNTTHGLSKIAEYKVWHAMLDRCQNPEHEAFPHYGARGITVCERWRTFENFLSDMGRRPSARHSLDRVDNDKGYSPENCRWTTAKTQNRNHRGNVMLTYDGRTQCIAAWAEETGIGFNTIRLRIKNHGWSVERALTTPPTSPADRAGMQYKTAKKYAHDGHDRTLREWADALGVSEMLLRQRLQRGMSFDRVFVSGRHRRGRAIE